MSVQSWRRISRVECEDPRIRSVIRENSTAQSENDSSPRGDAGDGVAGEQSARDTITVGTHIDDIHISGASDVQGVLDAITERLNRDTHHLLNTNLNREVQSDECSIQNIANQSSTSHFPKREGRAPAPTTTDEQSLTGSKIPRRVTCSSTRGELIGLEMRNVNSQLYGLREAPALWFQKLDEVIREQGFRRAEEGLYLR